MAELPDREQTSRPRHNLPLPAEPLVGRAQEVAILRAQLSGGAVRLLTLTGPGGTGKTRLAVELALALLDVYTDGIFFVALGSVSDARLAGATIAQTLGVAETGGQSLREALQGYVRDRRLLLVLDNFEQVIGAAPLVAELLDGARQLDVLVTSRQRLQLPGEHVFDVPPLGVPDPDALREGEGVAAAVEHYEAVQLFVQRAQAIHPAFRLTDSNGRAVAEICARLSGLPLAIELAAARIPLLPPEALLQRLERGLHLLSGAAFNLPPRQQSLRGSIALSYNLLSTQEQRLFRRLGVFAGGWTQESAAAVCGDPGAGLASLSDKSLIRRDQRPDREQRFFMLEPIREYALEQLRASGEVEAIRQRQARFFLALAERAQPELTGPEQQHWLDRLAVEHDNLRAVLSWTLGRGDGDTALRLATALWRFWHTRGYLSEGQTWLQSALSTGATAAPVLRAQAQFAAAALAWAQADYATAQAAAEASLAVRRELDDTQGIAASLNVLGLLYQDQGDHAAARAVLEESNALCRAMKDDRGIGVTLLNLGETARALGDLAKARALLEESLQYLRTVGDIRYIGSALDYLGTVAYDQQDYATAHALLSESLTLRWTVRDMSGIARTLGGVARVIVAVGGDAAHATKAARLLGAAEAIREEIGAPLPAVDRPRYERVLEVLQAYLDPAALDTAWAAGRAMPVDQAIAEALQAGVPAAGDGR